jgi:hypothetical protein
MTADMIRGAITKALQTINLTVNNDEIKQGFEDGTAYINLMKVDYARQIRNKYIATFSFEVIYFTLSKSDAYNMGDSLMILLDNITTGDGTIKGSSISYRYIEDSLHFYVSYVVSLYKPTDAVPLMETDTLTAGTKGE